MYRIRARGQKLALAATVLGTAMLLAAGYFALSDDAPEAPPAEAPSVSIPPPDPGTDDVPEGLGDALDPDGGLQPGFGTNGVDPFDNLSGSRQVYDVKIDLNTDGKAKFVYRYRTGYSDPKTASGPVSVAKRIAGPRAVAQVFVQLVGGSYATCSISIDGKTVSSSTARKMYDVVVCTG